MPSTALRTDTFLPLSIRALCRMTMPQSVRHALNCVRLSVSSDGVQADATDARSYVRATWGHPGGYAPNVEWIRYLDAVDLAAAVDHLKECAALEDDDDWVDPDLEDFARAWKGRVEARPVDEGVRLTTRDGSSRVVRCTPDTQDPWPAELEELESPPDESALGRFDPRRVAELLSCLHEIIPSRHSMEIRTWVRPPADRPCSPPNPPIPMLRASFEFDGVKVVGLVCGMDRS